MSRTRRWSITLRPLILIPAGMEHLTMPASVLSSPTAPFIRTPTHCCSRPRPLKLRKLLSFDYGRRVDAGSSAEGIASDHRSVRWNWNGGRGRNRVHIPLERTKVVVPHAEQVEIHQQLFHRRVSHALADSKRGAVHA